MERRGTDRVAHRGWDYTKIFKWQWKYKDDCWIIKKIKNHLKKGKINAAVIFLTNNMHDGILPLNNETLNKLKEKHPKSKNANNVLLTGVPQDVHLIMLAGMDEEMTRKAAFDSGKKDLDLRQWMQMDVEGFYVQITLVMQT